MNPNGDDDLLLIEDSVPVAGGGIPWKILVVDDDEEVHAVTRIALGSFSFENRPVEIIGAKSAAEARTTLAAHPDTALILLDVVMESDHAGLDYVRFVREELKNVLVRIVLRTGQPGQAPARQVVTQYEIDDYRTKSELTYERLVTLVMSSLRTSRLLVQMQQKREELERSNLELESFAYAASHDLQTPIRGIRNFSQMLQKRYGSQLDEGGREMLGFIISGGLQLHQLIGGLLEYSRATHVEGDAAPVDLNAVMDAVARTLQPALATAKTTLHYADLPTVRGHAVQLEQLLRNLVDNAIKLQTPGGGNITVSAAHEGKWQEIRVHDQGIGIPQEYLERIFELFKKLHTPEEYQGSGLGLSLCRKIARLHGGSLHAESVPGEGSTFVLRLPAE